MKRMAVAALAVLLVAGCPRNKAPEVASTPTGPSAIAKDSLATFSTTAIDADGDSVAIRFDWGDGDTSDWSAVVASGQSVSMSHAWSAEGVFPVCAVAKDKRGSLSEYSLPATARVIACWIATLGGSDGDDGESVLQTPDGGYIVVGMTYSYGAGNSDVWLVKADASGNKLWDRTFGGSEWDFASSVQPTADGGYIILGQTESYGAGGTDAWLIKTDPEGNPAWDKTFGGEDWDLAYSVTPTLDGGYVFTGATFSGQTGSEDLWLVKTDAAGNKLWDRTFGGPDIDVGRSVLQNSDGGLVVAGWITADTLGYREVWLVKTDAEGNEVWDRQFGGAEDDLGFAVRQTTDGGYVIAGMTYDSKGESRDDVLLVKTDGDGNKVWDRVFAWARWEDGVAVQQTSDGAYIVAGYTDSFGEGYSDVPLIKTIGP